MLLKIQSAWRQASTDKIFCCSDMRQARVAEDSRFFCHRQNSTLPWGWNHARFFRYSLQGSNWKGDRQMNHIDKSRCDSCSGFIARCYEAGAITRPSIVGGGSISGSLCTIGRPFATSLKIWLIVSSVRVAATCSLRTARMAVEARRKRFSI